MLVAQLSLQDAQAILELLRSSYQIAQEVEVQALAELRDCLVHVPTAMKQGTTLLDIRWRGWQVQYSAVRERLKYSNNADRYSGVDSDLERVLSMFNVLGNMLREARDRITSQTHASCLTNIHFDEGLLPLLPWKLHI